MKFMSMKFIVNEVSSGHRDLNSGGSSTTSMTGVVQEMIGGGQDIAAGSGSSTTCFIFHLVRDVPLLVRGDQSCPSLHMLGFKNSLISAFISRVRAECRPPSLYKLCY